MKKFILHCLLTAIGFTMGMWIPLLSINLINNKIFISILPITISICALLVNYNTKNITSFKYSFDLLVKYADKMDVDLAKLNHKRQGEWVLLGLLLDSNTNNIFLKNKFVLNEQNIFSVTSSSYVPHENFINQIEILLEFVNRNLFFKKTFYVKQLRSILSNKTIVYLYLYATFSKDGLSVANLMKNLHFFGNESNCYLPKNINSNLYPDNNMKSTIAAYFLTTTTNTFSNNDNTNPKSLYTLLSENNVNP